MALARVKQVLNSLADIYARETSLIQRVMQAEVDQAAQFGDTVDVPELPAYAISDARSGGSLQDVSAEAHGATAIQITLDQFRMANVQLGADDGRQLLRGDFARQLAEQILDQLRADADDNLVEYFYTQAYDTAGTYHDNHGGDTLTRKKFLAARAKMIRAGSKKQNIELWIPDESAGEIDELVPAQAIAQPGGQIVAVPQVGSIAGSPVFSSPSLNHQRTIVSTAYSCTSGTMTITVAAGHNLVPGQRISFNTTTEAGDFADAYPIASVGATSIVVADLPNANGSATEAGLITCEDSMCLMVDRVNCRAAMQLIPQIREVDVHNRFASNIQAAMLFGRLARVGNVRVLHLAA